MARSGGRYVLENGKRRKVSGTAPAPRKTTAQATASAKTTTDAQKPQPAASSEPAKTKEAD